MAMGDGGQAIRAYLDRETIDKARQLGSGNFSLGLRLAVKQYKETEMSDFIDYTAGLECWINDTIKMIKCEYSRIDESSVMIRAVSGNNLGRIGWRSKSISKDAFDSRPYDPYDNTIEAVWALSHIGLIPASLE